MAFIIKVAGSTCSLIAKCLPPRQNLLGCSRDALHLVPHLSEYWKDVCTGSGCNKMGSLSCSLENILRWGWWYGIWWLVAHFAALSYLLLCLAPAQAPQRTHIAFTLPLSTWCESREHLSITEKVLSSELPRKSLRDTQVFAQHTLRPDGLPGTGWLWLGFFWLKERKLNSLG